MILRNKNHRLRNSLFRCCCLIFFLCSGQFLEAVQFDWDTQKWRSDEEKAFWMAIPDWGERRANHYRFRYNKDGEKIQYFQANGYSGYAKGYFYEEGVGFFKMVVHVKNGWVILKKVWHPNGEKHILRSYNEGVLNGRYIDWHSNGVRLIDGMTKNGKKEGSWTVWHSNGQKKEEGVWFNGKAHGVFEDWYLVGGKKAEQVFEDGELISAIVWKPSGQKCVISHVLNGEGVLLEYDGSGKEIDRNLIVSGKKLASK